MDKALYLLLGDAWLRREALSRLRQELREQNPTGLTELRFDGEEFSLREFVQALRAHSLFAEGRLLRVHRVDKLSASEASLLLKHLRSPLPPGRYVVLEGERLDKRSALYRFLSERGRVQEYPSPTRRELPAVVRRLLQERGLKLPPAGMRYLLESVEGEDVSRWAQEVTKLALYAHAVPGNRLTPEDVRGVVYADRGANVFAALEALLSRDASGLSKLAAVLEGGEEPARVFYLFAAQVRHLLATHSLAAEGLSREEIARRTGDLPWLVRRRLSLLRRLSDPDPTQALIDLLQALQEADVRMKRGEYRPEDALWTVALRWIYAVPVRRRHATPR